jgi:hypothetical protein
MSRPRRSRPARKPATSTPSANGHAGNGDGEYVPYQPPLPKPATSYTQPGSAARIQLYTARASAHCELFHPQDASEDERASGPDRWTKPPKPRQPRVVRMLLP